MKEIKLYSSLDYMKFILAFVVIATHCELASSFEEGQFMFSLIKSLIYISIPLFFICSGFLLWKKCIMLTKEEKLKRIKNYISNLLKLYLTWTIIYIPFTIIGFYNDNTGILTSIGIFFRNLLFVGENFMSWPLWYLLASVVAGIILYCMVKYDVKYKNILITSILLTAIGLTLNYLHSNPNLPSWLQIIVDLYFSVFKTTRNGFFIGFIYITIGVGIAANKWNISKIGNLILATIGFTIMNITHSSALITASSILTSSALFAIIYQWNVSNNNERNKRIRLMSKYIYLTHMLFLGTIYLIKIEMPIWTIFLVVSLLSTITAFALTSKKVSKLI